MVGVIARELGDSSIMMEKFNRRVDEGTLDGNLD